VKRTDAHFLSEIFMTHAEMIAALAETLGEGPGAEFSARLEAGAVLVRVSGEGGCGGIVPLESGVLAAALAREIHSRAWAENPWGPSGPYEGDDGEEWSFLGEVR
jgi:hypothetical protein